MFIDIWVLSDQDKKQSQHKTDFETTEAACNTCKGPVLVSNNGLKPIYIFSSFLCQYEILKIYIYLNQHKKIKTICPFYGNEAHRCEQRMVNLRQTNTPIVLYDKLLTDPVQPGLHPLGTFSKVDVGMDGVFFTQVFFLFLFGSALFNG